MQYYVQNGAEFQVCPIFFSTIGGIVLCELCDHFRSIDVYTIRSVNEMYMSSMVQLTPLQIFNKILLIEKISISANSQTEEGNS